MINYLKIIWKFSRPHTIIGSVISIVTLYLIAYNINNNFDLKLLVLSLITGITCNVFIVGINQVADIEIDKINKPTLPIPAGILSVTQAKRIVYSALVICYICAFMVSPVLLAIVICSTFVGWAYSMPPFYLKKHHISSAFAISFVRAIMLNAGGFMVFNLYLNDDFSLTYEVKILTLFVFAFSVVISWFKDLSDVEGDSKFNIKTLALTLNSKQVLVAGNIVVLSAYLFTILYSQNNTSLQIGHGILLLLFILNTISIKLNNKDSVRMYYKRFWWFFFAEYLLYLIINV